MNNFGEKVSFIWSVADLLRGPYKPAQYGRVILPLTVLRRLDCVLEPTKDKVLKKAATLKGGKVANVEPILNRVAGVPFHNTSKLDFHKLKGEPDKIAADSDDSSEPPVSVGFRASSPATSPRFCKPQVDGSSPTGGFDAYSFFLR